MKERIWNPCPDCGNNQHFIGKKVIIADIFSDISMEFFYARVS